MSYEGDLRIKYIEDVAEDLALVGELLIHNVMAGVMRNIGVTDLTRVVKPEPLQKAQSSFLSRLKAVVKKHKGIILGGKGPDPQAPFEIKGQRIYRKGKPMSVGDWQKFEQEIMQYMAPYMKSMSEEAAIKAVLLSFATAQAEMQRKQMKYYGKKSYEQILDESFNGYIPGSFDDLDKIYSLDGSKQRAMNEAYQEVAQYVQRVDDDVREAIRRQVVIAHRTGKTPEQLASDLYWMQEDNPELRDLNAEQLQRDWRRVAYTEMAALHGIGHMGAYEDQAEASLSSGADPIYFVFTGGTCEYCGPREGTVLRMIPKDAVADELDDSLAAQGIKDDPYAKLAIWNGKTNVGLKRAQWRICIPVHPWGRAKLQRFYPADQKWDKDLKVAVLDQKQREERGEAGLELPKTKYDDYLEKLKTQVAERERQKQADRRAGIYKKDKEYFKDGKPKPTPPK